MLSETIITNYQRKSNLKIIAALCFITDRQASWWDWQWSDQIVWWDSVMIGTRFSCDLGIYISPRFQDHRKFQSQSRLNLSVNIIGLWDSKMSLEIKSNYICTEFIFNIILQFHNRQTTQVWSIFYTCNILKKYIFYEKKNRMLEFVYLPSLNKMPEYTLPEMSWILSTAVVKINALVLNPK